MLTQQAQHIQSCMLSSFTFSTTFTEEDRRARRRKLGLPEELTEEEKAQEAAAAAQKAEAAKKKGSFVTVKPISGMLKWQSVTGHDSNLLNVQLLAAYLQTLGIVSHPAMKQLKCQAHLGMLGW